MVTAVEVEVEVGKTGEVRSTDVTDGRVDSGCRERARAAAASAFNTFVIC